MRNLLFALVGATAAIALIPSLATAHPGRTDASGCHTNRATGEYHCHGSNSTPSTQNPTTASYSVVSVGDGDTLRIRQGNNTITVRLACIDAPEMGQAPHGAASRDRLQQLIPAGTAVSLRTVDVDRYGRTVAEVFRGQTNLNLAMVQEGRAAVYRQYASQCNQVQYLAAETTARQRRLAFWSQPNPVMPWDFRRNN